MKAMTECEPSAFTTYLPVLGAWIETRLFPSQKGLAVYFRDMTAQKKAEDKLKSALFDLQNTAANLERINRELEHFAAVASHDLKEPLKTICLLLEVAESADREKAKSLIGLSRERAKRCISMVDHLLNCSRSAATADKLTVVDLNLILENVTLNLGSLISSHSARVQWQSLPKVLGNFDQLVQVFQNLVANSIKYRKLNVDPVVSISAVSLREKILIKVKDNGRGILRKNLPHIFEFHQTYAEDSDRFESDSYGLGLATVKRLLSLHGANIEVSSEVGVGTNFTLRFPTKIENHS